MDSKKLDAKIDDVAADAKNLVAKAKETASVLAHKARGLAERTEAKVEAFTTKGENRVEETADKASHAATQIVDKVAHGVQETAQKDRPQGAGAGEQGRAPWPGDDGLEVERRGQVERRPAEDAVT